MKEFWQAYLPGWPPFGPDTKGRARFFGLGEVRLAVLSMIAESPRNGYQIIKELASRLGYFYRASSGTVYPVLKQLEKEGLAESRIEGGRNLYRPTRKGRALLASEAAAVAQIWSRAEQAEDLGHAGPHALAIAAPLNELYQTALRASNWAAGDPNREDQVREVLRNTTAALNYLMKPEKEKR
ncbi:MAG TPA: PadR family transcriptional regulator [Bryobacteraceae bacterium]|nr:PadR family transcriptional regulator [Bryobacteraceae bacterium]